MLICYIKINVFVFITITSFSLEVMIIMYWILILFYTNKEILSLHNTIVTFSYRHEMSSCLDKITFLPHYSFSGPDNFCLIHVSLIPVLGVVGEQVIINYLCITVLDFWLLFSHVECNIFLPENKADTT